MVDRNVSLIQDMMAFLLFHNGGHSLRNTKDETLWCVQGKEINLSRLAKLFQPSEISGDRHIVPSTVAVKEFCDQVQKSLGLNKDQWQYLSDMLTCFCEACPPVRESRKLRDLLTMIRTTAERKFQTADYLPDRFEPHTTRPLITEACADFMAHQAIIHEWAEKALKDIEDKPQRESGYREAVEILQILHGAMLGLQSMSNETAKPRFDEYIKLSGDFLISNSIEVQEGS